MPLVTACPLPDIALLRRHADRPGCLSDCFRAALPRAISLPELVRAFYDSRAFAPEALLLRLATGRDMGPDARRALADGVADHFGMWRVEARNDTQLVMAVGDGPIRSWWMVDPAPGGQTHLYFGSAVLPRPGAVPRVPAPIRASHGLHKLYSRLLLGSTVKRLRAPASVAEAR
jgi:hypothetical protein